MLLYNTGGWNNNPTVLHFKSTFRKLMVRCGVKPNTNGNAVPLDVTTCLAQTQPTASLPADDENILDPFVEQEFQTDIMTSVKSDFLMENIIV